MSRIMYEDLIEKRTVQRRPEYIEMDNLERTFLDGKITEKEYDEGMDAVMRAHNDRAREEEHRGRHDW